MSKLTAFLDLTRAHFIPAWILIFTAGFATGTVYYGGFSLILLLKVILIGAFGFEAGMVLNDWVDRDLDKKEQDHGLTKYFRFFKTRPLVLGTLSPRQALATAIALASIAVGLIITLPSPHCWYVLVVMLYSYIVEYFYQIKKRKQQCPYSQLIGRTDFALFPVAGYLVIGHPDFLALMYFLFFYALAEAHLGINDLADLINDKAKKLVTIPRLYGSKGTVYWIGGFLFVHIVLSVIFIFNFQSKALPGFLLSYALLILVGYKIANSPKPKTALQFLPLVHGAMALQAIALILSAWF
ncbi:UbiA family prenyltransferase [Candidatus Beckwithbacteria bacterium]|nr:UbiA family prenyltransferase [Candidatus Beckwithbacteria bacterium]